MCMIYVPCLFHPIIHQGHLGCFHVLATMSIGVHVALQISASQIVKQRTRRGIAGSYGSSLFLIFGGTSLLFSIVIVPTYIPVSSVWWFLSLQHVLSLVLLIHFLMDVRWYLIMVLIWISLIASEVEHLFIYLVAICMSFWKKCSSPLTIFT